MGRVLIASDNFNRATLDANWENLNSVDGNVAITGSVRFYGTANNASSGVARWIGAGTFSDDQYSKATLAGAYINLTLTYFVGVCVRASSGTGAARDFYEIITFDDGTAPTGPYTVTMNKVVNGTKTQLATTAALAWALGDTISIEAVGSQIRGYRNDVLITGFDITDTALTTGLPGVVCSGDSTTLGGDNWEGGDFSSAPPAVVLTGTVTAGIAGADIVAGGNTIILTVSDDTVVPAATVQTIGYIANALGGTTDTTSFSITLPTTAAGDILLLEFCHRGIGDGTIGGTSITTGGLTWTQKHSQLFTTSTFSGKLLWTRATGDHAGQTVTGSSLTNSCAAILTQYRNVIASGDPFTGAATIVGEENASGNETQAEITTLVDGCMVCLTVLNSPDLAVATQACTSPGALAERAERLSTGGTDASIAHASELKATAGATGALTWAQTNAASGSYAYALQPIATTPFADARAAIISGIDSAQSEGGGWDAKVKPNIPVANVVRTSNTVITIDLQAQADYAITAQETITANVPATALVAAGAVVATPTFTINLPPAPTEGGYQLNYHR